MNSLVVVKSAMTQQYYFLELVYIHLLANTLMYVYLKISYILSMNKHEVIQRQYTFNISSVRKKPDLYKRSANFPIHSSFLNGSVCTKVGVD